MAFSHPFKNLFDEIRLTIQAICRSFINYEIKLSIWKCFHISHIHAEITDAKFPTFCLAFFYDLLREINADHLGIGELGYNFLIKDGWTWTNL